MNEDQPTPLSVDAPPAKGKSPLRKDNASKNPPRRRSKHDPQGAHTGYAPYKDEIVARLLAGQGVRFIARAIGCSPQAVFKQKRRLGVIGVDPDDPGKAIVAGRPEPVTLGQLRDQMTALEVGATNASAVDAERARGMRLLWQIATDAGAAPASRVQAIDKLSQMQSWDYVQQARNLPTPLDEEAKSARLTVLLSTYTESVISHALHNLGWTASPPPETHQHSADEPDSHQEQHG